MRRWKSENRWVSRSITGIPPHRLAHCLLWKTKGGTIVYWLRETLLEDWGYVKLWVFSLLAWTQHSSNKTMGHHVFAPKKVQPNYKRNAQFTRLTNRTLTSAKSPKILMRTSEHRVHSRKNNWFKLWNCIQSPWLWPRLEHQHPHNWPTFSPTDYATEICCPLVYISAIAPEESSYTSVNNITAVYITLWYISEKQHERVVTEIIVNVNGWITHHAARL